MPQFQIQQTTLITGKMAERSKALGSGRSNFGCVGSYPPPVEITNYSVKLHLASNAVLPLSTSANTLEAQDKALSFTRWNDKQMRALKEKKETRRHRREKPIFILQKIGSFLIDNHLHLVSDYPLYSKLNMLVKSS